ncbi:hypothetical protein TWF694_005711 [Orbilia ellipsospora]|uniref:Uncharacterized protein n=1 Tax=Orbilia ellipsospora TaxID=2528407 RepID=A0AAV9WRR5_9PEZI
MSSVLPEFEHDDRWSNMTLNALNSFLGRLSRSRSSTRTAAEPPPYSIEAVLRGTGAQFSPDSGRARSPTISIDSGISDGGLATVPGGNNITPSDAGGVASSMRPANPMFFLISDIRSDIGDTVLGESNVTSLDGNHVDAEGEVNTQSMESSMENNAGPTEETNPQSSTESNNVASDEVNTQQSTEGITASLGEMVIQSFTENGTASAAGGNISSSSTSMSTDTTSSVGNVTSFVSGGGSSAPTNAPNLTPNIDATLKTRIETHVKDLIIHFQNEMPKATDPVRLWLEKVIEQLQVILLYTQEAAYNQLTWRNLIITLGIVGSVLGLPFFNQRRIAAMAFLVTTILEIQNAIATARDTQET